jgi:hypothetical protein
MTKKKILKISNVSQFICVKRSTDFQEADVNFPGHTLLFRVMSAVLKEINTLPNTEGQTAVINGNGQAGLSKG